MSAAPVSLRRLRPEPWPITPLGPYRLAQDGTNKLIQFPTLGHRVIKWIEANCVWTDGKWVGQPVVLADWERQLLLDLFELVPDQELGRMRLRYRSALVGIPKKNGKTELAAFVALWFLLASGRPSAGIAVAAAADYQADLVFGAAARCIELSPTLSQLAEVWQREIRVPGRVNAVIRRVAAAGGKLDGMKLITAIMDELHEWVAPNQRKVFGMLRGALALEDEPLTLMITTAGVDDGEEDEEAIAPWLRMYRYGRLVESGEVDDDAFFFRWWMAPEGCDHRDLDLVMDPAVNPNAGVTVQRAFYADELTKRTESEYRRYYLNQPSDTINVWLDHGTWEACQVAHQIEPQRGVSAWVAWDASTKRDSTAVAVVQRIDGRVRASVRIWERPYRNGEPVQDWRVPRQEVIDHVVGLCEQLPVVAIGYDPAFIAWVVEDLEDRGLPLVEWPQSNERMMFATQAMYEAIVDRRLAHDGDPALTRHVKAAKVKGGPRGQRLVKSESGRHIDAAVALAMAIGLMERVPEPEKPKGISVYIPGEIAQ